ncbi:hypothetical protein [Aquimarina sp. AU119]|uniref:hypothetical protein n=1 Tax=Aquimarina sp. AU119 TaxID=2108528 RepID=UPI000D698E1E|nr:hypothetical protein [Aquimarina sp. AU119]
MILKYLTYIGLYEENDGDAEIIQEVYEPTTSIELAKRYLIYLKEIDNYQKDRRITIENKNSQLVGQASIVTSIFALFVPLLIGSLNGVSLMIKIPLIIIFIFVLFHYLFTIYHAIKTLKINRYTYATRNTKTVTKLNRAETELDFLNEEVSDLVFTINQTSPIDNKKGGNLILGTRCFEIANFGFGIFTLAIILSAFSINKEIPEVKIKNIEEIKLAIPDTLNTKLVNFKSKDTITIKIDTLNNKVNNYQINKTK